MIAAHQTMLAPPALPYDAEVEYLESTGTQYIDTGVLPTTDTSFRCSLQRTDTSTTDKIAFGSRHMISGYAYYDISCWTNPSVRRKGIAFHYAYGTDNSQFDDSGWVYKQSITSSFVNLYVTPKTISVNGSTVHTFAHANNRAAFTSQYKTYLFAMNVSNTSTDARTFIGKIASFSIEKSGVLAFDGIPVRIGQTGYLFDRVSGQLFGNAGTGAFTIGPDK